MISGLPPPDGSRTCRTRREEGPPGFAVTCGRHRGEAVPSVGSAGGFGRPTGRHGPASHRDDLAIRSRPMPGAVQRSEAAGTARGIGPKDTLLGAGRRGGLDSGPGLWRSSAPSCLPAFRWFHRNGTGQAAQGWGEAPCRTPRGQASAARPPVQARGSGKPEQHRVGPCLQDPQAEQRSGHCLSDADIIRRASGPRARCASQTHTTHFRGAARARLRTPAFPTSGVIACGAASMCPPHAPAIAPL